MKIKFGTSGWRGVIAREIVTCTLLRVTRFPMKPDSPADGLLFSFDVSLDTL